MGETAIGACVHHWVLAHPEDDVVRGRCKRCGETREYPATVEGASRQGVYEDAASMNRTVSLLPDIAGDRGGDRGLPGGDRVW